MSPAGPHLPPTLRVDLDGVVPVYRQIVSQLRALLVAGAFRPDDQLPTVRQLALDLGVHHNTVAEAYRILADEGWLALRRRRGVTVLARATPRPAPRARSAFAARLGELVAEATAHGLAAADVARALRAAAERLVKEAA